MKVVPNALSPSIVIVSLILDWHLVAQYMNYVFWLYLQLDEAT